MRDVPALDPVTEARLVERYHQTEGLTNKHAILRILAFGGGQEAVRLLTNAVLAEFAQKRVTPAETAILLYLPELLGILARGQESAAQFLLDGARPEFWARRQLWEGPFGTPTPSMLSGGCIKGLAMSGREESQRLLDYYWDHPDEAGVQQVDGAVVDAAFLTSVLTDVGLERTVDDVLYDFDGLMRAFRSWLKTPDGGKWFPDWAGRAEEASHVTRKRSQ
jgi:hypothetical protein